MTDIDTSGSAGEGQKAILKIVPGSPEWKKLRKRAQTDLYWLNAKVLNHEKVVPMTFRAHYALCRFAARMTGIPEIDGSRIQLIQVSRNWGKALALSTLIPTPSGWTTMGELKAGDSIFAEDGSVTEVTWASPIMLGNPCHRVTFSDSSSVVADAEHLWVVENNRGARNIRTTAELAQDLKEGSRSTNKWWIRNAAPIQLPEADLLVDPYLLGLWLGDGSTDAAYIHTADLEIVESIRQLGYEVTDAKADFAFYVRDLVPRLRELGVLGNKHVPSLYLRGSQAQRLALLQGLMDTDGEAHRSCREVRFTSTKLTLADAVYELVVSLGMRAFRSEHPAKLNGRDCGTAYRITFSPSLPVFRLKRKLERIQAEPKARSLKRAVTAITSVPSVAVRCVAVAHPSRQFLCGDGMIPTHNTTTITKGRTIQRILQDQDWAAGIANERSENANAFLASIKMEFETNQLLQILFPEIIPDFRQTVWKSDRIFVNRTRPNPINPSVLAIGTGGTVTGVHMNEWIVDDLLSQDVAENARSGSFSEIEKLDRWVDRLEYLLARPKEGPITFIGCIAKDEPVLMADGTWKPIQDIEIGDEVWSEKKDGSEGFRPRKVTGVWPQGFADVVEVNVAGRKLVCTDNHPLLAARGREDGHGRVIKEAREFSREHGSSTRGPLIEVFEGMPGMGKKADEELYWLLGFMWGDGWVTRCERPNGDVTYSVFFALGEEVALNARASTLLERYFGGTLYNDGRRSLRMDNTEAGRTLEEWGLKPGVRAPEKRIPDWIFRSRWEGKRAFLRGLCDADGHQQTEIRWDFSTSSKGLAEDVRKLAMTCNVRPTLVHENHAIRQAPNSPKPIFSFLYHIGLNFLDSKQELKRYGVKEVKKLNVQRPVYDLTIEDGDCTFVASGLDCWNTPWWPGDTYDYIESLYGRGQPDREFVWTLRLPDGHTQHIHLTQKGELAVFRFPAVQNGQPVEPRIYDEARLEQLQQDNPAFYAAQVLLKPTEGSEAAFDPEDLKLFEWENHGQIRYKDNDGRTRFERVPDLQILMSVDPAISTKTSAARSAISVIGSNGKALFLLESWAQRCSVTVLANKILEFYKRYHPTRLIIEAVAYQMALAEMLTMMSREQNVGLLPIYEYRSGADRVGKMRIASLQSYFKRGFFHYHPSQRDFLQEYTNFSPDIGNRTVDILDSIAFQKESWEALGFLAGDARQGNYLQKHAEAEHNRVQRLRDHFSRRRLTQEWRGPFV